MSDEEAAPVRVAYARRNRDLDPQLVWRGKDQQDASDLVVQAPPLYIQEKVHPKVLIDDLVRQTKERQEKESPSPPDLFADFNGLPDGAARTEFYSHDANWSNRMILGDSLQVMASLAEREGLRGKVQCIYIDPPYGIRFNSNFQWSTTSRDVRDGKAEHITREPEQVKAFRDTWRDGIHSYLTYLRDRLTVARDLLTVSGSVFVQIGDENVHRVRALMDEIFGEENYLSQTVFRKTTGKGSLYIDNTYDVIIWYSRDASMTKYRTLYYKRKPSEDSNYRYSKDRAGALRALTKEELKHIDSIADEIRVSAANPMTSQSSSTSTLFEYSLRDKKFSPGKGGWKTNLEGMQRLCRASRLYGIGKTLRFVRPFSDFDVQSYNDIWDDTRQSGFGDEKVYVVQTATRVIERCILMATDPGDLVLDPTCGSGTTAFVAEHWGRRWIAIDTSRVALALARARIMSARYPWYLLADSPEGKRKEGEITKYAPSNTPTHGDVRQGFVYERVPHITLKSIANNSEIDVIWEKWQKILEPLRTQLNAALSEDWEEWEILRDADEDWPDDATAAHAKWWEARIARQEEIDASIAAKADHEYLFDKPYTDDARIRVAGPFTVESLAPHRMLAVDENDELFSVLADQKLGYGEAQNFTEMILGNLRTAGVQQSHKQDRITFNSLVPWPGHYVCAEGRYVVGGVEAGATRRAGVFIGPEFGTVARPDLVAAAREAADAGFDVLVACAFSYDAHAAEFEKLGRIRVLKARMNADLHMAGDLKNTGKGNLFVIFGEPDIDILDDGTDKIRVRINGVDIFHPNTGEVRSHSADGIACWFVDTDYNEESFFVRHAYFLGANDPYKALKTTLKAEIDPDAWATLRSDTSRPFPKPASGRIAVKVINHLGDEAMKVFQF
ncbi:MAG: site-specific DNA-methyltransferase [Acidobacteriia bacterium]|nr:site-specific DNA-methyltransferase [Terriglobia bacterium]MYK09638.1 site-specific DNA-methyltransferase [Terriglobia bacterium]